RISHSIYLHTSALYLSHIVSFVLTLFSSSYPFFVNDPATTEIYTLSLHDALPISAEQAGWHGHVFTSADSARQWLNTLGVAERVDRKSTRLNSSHVSISYAVFCLKKKKTMAIMISNPRK